MSSNNSIDDPASFLHDLISGFHATHYISVGISCGLFEALCEPKTPPDLASQLGLYEPYVRRFCEAGLRWGLLVAVSEGSASDCRTDRTATDDRYRFRVRQPFVSFVADPDTTSYMGDFFRFLAQHAGPAYLDYPKQFRTGGTQPPADHGAELTEIIEGSTRGLQRIFFDRSLTESLPALERQLTAGGRVLDIGCGAGSLACQLCHRYPDISVTGIDPDTDAIDRARRRAFRENLHNRTNFRAERGEVTIERAGETFDAIVFFMSLHEIPRGDRRTIFERLGDVLKSGGVVTVFDEVYPERRSEFDKQPFAAAVETQWSELTWNTDVPTLSQQRELFALGGLTERSRTTLADRFVIYEGVHND